MNSTSFLVLLFASLLLFFSSCHLFENKQGKSIYVASYTLPCQAGELQKNCIQIKWNRDEKEWEHLYSPIEGFQYEEGYEYELLVKEEKIVNPPADGSSIKYTLLKVVSKLKK